MREDPDWMFFVADDRPNLVGPKLRNRSAAIFRALKRRQNVGCPFKPTSDGIPGDPRYPGDRRLVQALDAESGNFVEDCTTMLESMVRRSGV
jgi:hypothetical protein